MKYIISLVSLIVITFLIILLFFTITNKNNSFKGNLKRSYMFMLVVVPIVSLVGGLLFLLFKLITMLLPVTIETFDIFIVAITGVFIIFVSDIISKSLVSRMVSTVFYNKYKSQDLSENDVMNIAKENQKLFNTWVVVVMFLGTFALYTAVTLLMSIPFNLAFITIISVCNILGYKLFFRSKDVALN